MMKPWMTYIGMVIFLNTLAFADTRCFIVREKNTIIHQEGNCTIRYSPCSTFKIPLSLIGYEEGVLVDETHPEWPFEKGYADDLDSWKQPHNPTMWMKHSCVWYSQVLTQQLGMKKFKEYVIRLHYGNQDLSGDNGQDNGLTRSWLSSSLEISAEEQVDFLIHLLGNTLPFSLQSHQMTKTILFLENFSNGWKLYGKTGSGRLLNKDRSKKLPLQHGWFIGWIQKGERKIVFAHHIADDTVQDTYASKRAKEEAKERLINMIQHNHW